MEERRTEIAPCLFCLSESPFLDLDIITCFASCALAAGRAGQLIPLAMSRLIDGTGRGRRAVSRMRQSWQNPRKRNAHFAAGTHLSVAKDDRLYEDYIECANCHAGGSTAETPFEKDAETRAINKWNRAWKHLREARGSGIPLSLIKHPASTHLVELETLFWALLS